MKTAGIIGGLGPETTARFYLDMIFDCYRQNREARPGILLSSVPLPYHIEEDLLIRNNGTERYIPYLTAEAKRLEKAGADFIVMPCNSLHIYIDEIRNAVKIPVLSIIEETVKYLKKKNFKRPGILATSATINNRLYEKALHESNMELVIPDEVQQAEINRLIMNLVIGRRKNRDRYELIKIADDLERKEADCIALACTDLQLLIPEHPRLKIFDTMKLFAEATVAEILK